MRKRLSLFIRGFFAVVITSVLATLAISAMDEGGISQNALLASLRGGDIADSPCPAGMVLVPSGDGAFCIDAYPASAGDTCPFPNPQNQAETRENIQTAACTGVSEAGNIPWRHISQSQAAAVCAKSGKRLSTNKEWYQAALGTPVQDSDWGPQDCNIASRGAGSPAPAGSRANCVSSHGVYDMVGNVWEWVDATVYEGRYNERRLPDSGYVHGADLEGMPIETSSEQPDPNYDSDYFWINADITAGVFRGGYWGAGSDAGLHAVYAALPPSHAGVGVGFRCVQ